MLRVRSSLLRTSKARSAVTQSTQRKCLQRKSFHLRYHRTAVVLAAALLLAPGPAADAQSPLVTTAVDAHLLAGEFAPALHLAQATSGPERDFLLSKIASAQAASGATGPSLSTASEISDDRVRNKWVEGGFGGGPEADFEALLDLIISTVAPDSWEEVGGLGTAKEFENGIYVDAEGTLHRILRQHSGLALAKLRNNNRPDDTRPTDKSAVRQTSALRKVSLTRLEKHLQLLLASGHQPTAAMRVLAGLQKIEYVMVYPKTGDIVLAGPAGDWRAGDENRIVSTESGRPMYRLEDLIVVLRHIGSKPNATFGCSITPTTDGIARTVAFINKSSQTNLPPGQSEKYLKQLRSSLGKQNIEIFGIDPRTRVARVLIEADYRMKLVGMGLEEGVLGVKSYLDMVHVPEGEAPPPMDVLRWWFTLNYDALRTTKSRDVFALSGQGAKVLSENQLLSKRGERIATGRTDQLNRQFAAAFTKHFTQLAKKYPVYAEMRNIFDMALVAALIKSEKLDTQVHWHQTCFGDPRSLLKKGATAGLSSSAAPKLLQDTAGQASSGTRGRYQVSLAEAPQQVDTVIAHRVINRIHILAGVSGGVRIDPWPAVTRKAIKIDSYGQIEADRITAQPTNLPRDAWWWD